MVWLGGFRFGSLYERDCYERGYPDSNPKSPIYKRKMGYCTGIGFFTFSLWKMVSFEKNQLIDGSSKKDVLDPRSNGWFI